MIRRIASWFAGLPIRRAAWLLPLAWAIHEAEEWNIDAWYRRHFVDPGYFDRMSEETLWIGLAFVAAQGVVWTAIATLPKNPRIVAFLMLPYFIYISFGNALQHIFWLVYFRAYAPGIVTALLLVIPAVALFALRAIRERLVPWWYVALLTALTIPGVVQVVQAGNHVSPVFQQRHLSGMAMSERIVGLFRN